MRQAFSCSLLEAQPGSLAELRRCLEGWRIDCRPAALAGPAASRGTDPDHLNNEMTAAT